ncbi:Kazal-like serine protease inhibitor [Phytophthora megakarya]|uniref:Kazal-like serine protease inhibitor n=1 Tax=Phytophthora megakarya TaxID=4795 RepID=A0A225VTX8_9STRA|nr:Kazal-like serine protease inhibitor [Phytophthora megakarya]
MCSVGHLHHVLFTAVCLQNAKSSETLAAVVMVNIFQMPRSREILVGFVMYQFWIWTMIKLPDVSIESYLLGSSQSTRFFKA